MKSEKVKVEQYDTDHVWIGDRQYISLNRVSEMIKESGGNIKRSYKDEYLPIRDPKVKPPIGIMPKRICDKHRANELTGAMTRFIEAEKEIPIEWVIEYNKIIQEHVFKISQFSNETNGEIKEIDGKLFVCIPANMSEIQI